MPQSPFYPVKIILRYFTFTLDKITLIPICGLSRECRHESSVMHVTWRDLQFTMYFPKPVASSHSTQPWKNEMDLKRCVSFKVLSRLRPGLWKFCCNNEQSKNSCSSINNQKPAEQWREDFRKCGQVHGTGDMSWMFTTSELIWQTCFSLNYDL